MNLYHATDWRGLTVIIDKELIEPQELSASDRNNINLKSLADLHLKWAWFSTQLWSHSRFGAYAFQFESYDLILPKIVPLGNHNGARCFLSAPTILATWIASRLSASIIPTESDTKWRPKGPDDRVDILVTWAVPVATAGIEFLTSDRAGDSWYERNSNFASARFWAKMMLDDDHRFDGSAKDVIDLAAKLLRWVTGNTEAAFRKARCEVRCVPSRQPPDLLLRSAFDKLIYGDVPAAASLTARIGDFSEVADEVARRAGEHFPHQELTGAELVRACN